jgi:hypothetical protein
VQLGEAGATERHQRGVRARKRVIDEFEIGSVAHRYRQLYAAILRGEPVSPRAKPTATRGTQQVVAG